MCCVVVVLVDPCYIVIVHCNHLRSSYICTEILCESRPCTPPPTNEDPKIITTISQSILIAANNLALHTTMTLQVIISLIRI